MSKKTRGHRRATTSTRTPAAPRTPGEARAEDTTNTSRSNGAVVSPEWIERANEAQRRAAAAAGDLANLMEAQGFWGDHSAWRAWPSRP